MGIIAKKLDTANELIDTATTKNINWSDMNASIEWYDSISPEQGIRFGNQVLQPTNFTTTIQYK